MPENFISYNRYLGVCHENKISEEQNQDQLIDLLHSLGSVLNFLNHPILKDIIVLNPDWVTEGIYSLLSDEYLRSKTKGKGVFTLADLSRILNPEYYPSNRHSYLIELMKEFELCFALNCDPPQFLIPRLLPIDQPQDTQLEGETLEFQYHYRILPESILSRFIVIINDRIYNQIYWRNGVMLQYQENNETYNIARIQSDPEDKKIFIAISGRKETRRQFLSIIRDAFKKIHNTFVNLEISEWVPVPNHPEYPPLSYQDLLGLEAMDVKEYPIGKLKVNINIRQLLDGYESIESRHYEDMLDIAKRAASRPIIANTESIRVSQESISNNWQGTNIANFANEVKDNARQQANQHIHQAHNQNLAEAAKEIKDLLDQLDKDYDRNSITGQAMINAKIIEAIEKNSSLKARIVKALKETGIYALEELIDHPAIKILVATLKGFTDSE